MTAPSHRHIISVLVPDRVGILRDVAAAVTGMDGNIDNISQTVVEGYFTLLLTTTFDAPTPAEAVREAILRRFASDEVVVTVRDCGPPQTRPTVRGQRYIVTITGPEQKGIMHAVTTFLADKGVNVENWFVHLRGSQVTHVGEVTVPPMLDIKQLQDDVRSIMAPMGLTSGVQHENIFRVTNEVGAVRPLLMGKSDA